MSYSRFSNSYWYTFWDCSSGNTKEDQIFCICGFPTIHFSYEDLTDDINSCLDYVKKEYPNATKSQISELQTYMEEFITDVNSNFSGENE